MSDKKTDKEKKLSDNLRANLMRRKQAKKNANEATKESEVKK